MSTELTTKTTLPTVAELFADNLEQAFKHEQLNLLLNQEPKKEWVKEHPYIKGYKYLPIDKVEFMLRKIFKEFSIEVLREGLHLTVFMLLFGYTTKTQQQEQCAFMMESGQCSCKPRKEQALPI
jgi:hypothetical protein